MRHIRSILYSLVLAPAAWVLTAVGLTGDLTARGRDGFAVENFTGLLLLLLAGAAYGILVLGPFSPAGPLLAGVVYLAISAWALTAPAAYADVWPPAVAKDGFDLSRPAYGLATILAVPLICTALSARRWAKYEPPILPLVGQIGRARGAAPAQGTPLSIARTTVIGTGDGRTDPEPTTVLHLPPADSTTVVVAGATASAPADSTTAVVPAAVAPGDSTTAVSAAVDEDPTIVWSVPKGLAAIAVAEEDTAPSSRRPDPTDEPVTVIDVSVGDPTEAVATGDPAEAVAHEEPTEAVVDAELVEADDVVEEVADGGPTEAVADEGPTEAVADGGPTDDVADEGPTAVVAESEDGGVEARSAEAEVTESAAAADADEEPDESGEPDEDEATVALPAAGAERTEVIRLPVADDGDKTQVVRLPVADNGERTQVVRLPVAEVLPFPAADPEEKTQVIRPVQVLQFPVRSPGAEPGQRTRDLSHRATGDVGGDETQVIRLAGKTVDDEKTQVIRPALVTHADERADVLAFRAPKLRDATPPPAADGVAPTSPATVKPPTSIADAEAPNFAEDPTSPIVLSRNGDQAGEARSRSMTVMKMERPPDDPDEETTPLEIPAQRCPGNEE